MKKLWPVSEAIWMGLFLGTVLGGIVIILSGCATVNLNTGPASGYPDTPTFKSVILESRDDPNVKWRVVLISQCTRDMLCVDATGEYVKCTAKQCTHIEFEEVVDYPGMEFVPNKAVTDVETEYSIGSTP